MEERLAKALAQHPKTNETQKFVYGTSGFRTRWQDLDPILFRMGVLALVRSAKLGKTTGLVVTASHNPVGDNGVKLVDPSGDMMAQDWEPIATILANSTDPQFALMISKLLSISNLTLESCSSGVVVLGRDTRPSSDALAQAVREAITSLGGTCHDMGYTTTPQLHLIVHQRNLSPQLSDQFSSDWYTRHTADNFVALYHLSESDHRISESGTIHVDCANGVGGPVLAKIVPHIKHVIQIALHNTGNGVLNHECGADYVKTNEKMPTGVAAQFAPSDRFCSFDGDADRIVYWYPDEADASKCVLLDGDRIAILYAVYLKRLLDAVNLTSELDLCLVQTAYANGRSTQYIHTDLSPFRTVCTETGVKHLAEAAKKSDLGIFFEANGHGTVFYSDLLRLKLCILKESADSDLSVTQKDALRDLIGIEQLINQATGDAIADMLVVELILKRLSWSLADWHNLYQDLPSCLLKVSVPDRNEIKTSDAARRVVKPEGLQDEINRIVGGFGVGARSFVRPSGTEDIVRIFAEAASKDAAERLGDEICKAVLRFCA